MARARPLPFLALLVALAAVIIAPAVRAEVPPTARVATSTAAVPQPAVSVPVAPPGNARSSEGASTEFTASNVDQRDAWGRITNPQGTPTATVGKTPAGDGPGVVPPGSYAAEGGLTKSIGIDADTWSEHTASTSGTDMVPKAPLQETRPPGEAVTAIDEIRPAKPDPSDATPATIRRDAASEQNVRIVVGFKSGPVRTQSASTVHARQGAVVVSTIPQVSADVVTLADRAAAIAAVANYRVDPSVAFAEIDELRFALETPNDPRFGEQWGLAVVKAPDA